jgi:hypothetical protein
MTQQANLLDRSEYIEQGYLFQLLRERTETAVPMQEILEQIQHELLTTTRLPMAVDYLLTELKHSGQMAPAMRKLSHYFTSFQTYLVETAEAETGRFAMGTALRVLEADAKYRAEKFDSIGAFFYQFEVLCRNRLNYDKGLTAMSNDPIYDKDWAKWILLLRAQVGLVDFADLVFLVSKEYERRLIEAGEPTEGKGPFFIGEREGRIAVANRQKEPLYLFAALQRHLGYPKVPRPTRADATQELIPQMARRMERMEARLMILEQEQRGGMDLTKFYKKLSDGSLPLPEVPES